MFRWEQITILLKQIFSIFVPPICAHCKRSGSLICAECKARLPYLNGPICLRCGRPQMREVDQCWNCRHNSSSLQQVRATFTFDEPIKSIIYELKYHSVFALAEPLVELMLAHPVTWQNPAEMVIPIPLHPKRQRKRGYNQSALLAKQLNRHWHIPLDEKALQRVRYTRPQVGLNHAERQLNVADAFIANQNRVGGKHIMLIDDVFTTGATMSAAADALAQAGARSVVGYCVARTIS